MRKIAFATCARAAEISADDAHAIAPLREAGIAVDAVVWDAPGVRWQDYEAVIVRATWDYHEKPLELYTRWLESFRGAGRPRLWNPPEAILGNVHKKYLLELEQQGVRILPTVYLPAGAQESLGDVVRGRGWGEVVVKPAVSAGAASTWKCSAPVDAASEERFREQVRTRDVLVQEFRAEIVDEGEWSFLFFRGEFSHAVLKNPVRGSFTFQASKGGTFAEVTPTPAQLAQARAVLAHVSHELLYARVDGLFCGGEFALMELEINEPRLFLTTTPGAGERFARAIAASL